jgi:thioredoxin reductase
VHRGERFRARQPFQDAVGANALIEVLWHSCVLELCGTAGLESLRLLSALTEVIDEGMTAATSAQTWLAEAAASA